MTLPGFGGKVVVMTGVVDVMFNVVSWHVTGHNAVIIPRSTGMMDVMVTSAISMASLVSWVSYCISSGGVLLIFSRKEPGKNVKTNYFSDLLSKLHAMKFKFIHTAVKQFLK